VLARQGHRRNMVVVTPQLAVAVRMITMTRERRTIDFANSPLA
jgi:hypothetical protein